MLLVTSSVRGVSAEHMSEQLAYVETLCSPRSTSLETLSSSVVAPLLLFIVACVCAFELFSGRVCTTLQSAGWSAVMAPAQVQAACCRAGLLGASFWGS